MPGKERDSKEEMPNEVKEMGGRNYGQVADTIPIYILSQNVRTSMVPSIKKGNYTHMLIWGF